jgi:hypothetical protein
LTDTPGRGSEINVITQTLTTLPTPMESNPVWQETNKRLRTQTTARASDERVETVVINNKIFGVGDPVPPFFWVHCHHQELLEQIGGGFRR